MSELAGRVALISGGLGDIGKAIGRELARRGADIALCDLANKVEDVDFLDDLHRASVRVRYDRVDISDAHAVSQWVANVEAELGIPDLIIPNAAIVTLKSIRDIPPEEWQRELSINLNGAFYMAQDGAKRLLAAGKPGRIIFIGSWAAHSPHTILPTYCVAKAGLRMLMQCMALEFAPQGILVNEVAPGYVDAGLSAKVFVENPKAKKRAVAQVPNRLLITPDEVALQVAHLCHPDNRHMVGTTLLMDGGLSLLTPAG